MENSFAVITNATREIGLELARQLGTHKTELLICSSSDEIFETQTELEQEGFTVEAMKVNLATFNGVENLLYHIQTNGKRLDALVINTISDQGENFLESDLKEKIKLINFNLVSTIHLLKRLLPQLAIKDGGKVLITTSNSSDSVYSASKAFISSFVESMRREMRGRGVTITLLKLDEESDNEELAKHAIEAMQAGKENVSSEGPMTKIKHYALKIFPEKTKIQFRH